MVGRVKMVEVLVVLYVGVCGGGYSDTGKDETG